MKKFFVFIFMFFVFNFSAMAAHLELERVDGVYSNQFDNDTGEYYSYRQNKYIMDGRIVYCVAPGVDITTMEYDSYDLSYSRFSVDILNRISLIGYFGYDYPGHQTDNYFLAAQELIWEAVGNNEAYFTTGLNNGGSVIDIESEKAEIISLVDNFMLRPSFNGGRFNISVGNSIDINDSNYVLSDYYIVSSNNDAHIDDDKLVVDVSNVGNDKILLARKKYDNLNSVFYAASGSQDFMFLRAIDDIISYVTVNGYIPYSTVSIYKTGDVLVDYVDGKFIYDERGLDGVQFGIYADDDIYVLGDLVYKANDLIYTIVTDNGVAVSDKLPNGMYYIREISNSSDFILMDDVHFKLYNNKFTVSNYDISLKNERKNVSFSLNKKGEVGDHLENLSGVNVGLYCLDDIYSYDGNLLLVKDSLIGSFITDSNGNIDVSLNVPLCSYYFKELSTLDSYNLDDSEHLLNVSNDFNSIHYYLDSSLINTIKRGDIIINKFDLFGNRLSGAVFELIDSSNNIFSDVTTNGYLKFSGLPYGDYKLFEVGAPDGYVSNGFIGNISVNSDSFSVDVFNEKLPKTSDIYYFNKLFSIISIGFGFILLVISYDKKIKNS